MESDGGFSQAALILGSTQLQGAEHEPPAKQGSAWNIAVKAGSCHCYLTGALFLGSTILQGA